MAIFDKLSDKIQYFIKEIETLREENTILKLQLRSINKTKQNLEQNNQEIYSKITQALESKNEQ